MVVLEVLVVLVSIVLLVVLKVVMVILVVLLRTITIATHQLQRHPVILVDRIQLVVHMKVGITEQ